MRIMRGRKSGPKTEGAGLALLPPSLPHRQAVDMTALETFTTASKQPLTTGRRRPDMTALETFTTASKQPLTTGRRPDMTAVCVRRAKAALSSGCKPRPATAPAGSNRSSHGGNKMAEAFGVAGHI